MAQLAWDWRISSLLKELPKLQNLTAGATLELIISRGCAEECAVSLQPT